MKTNPDTAPPTAWIITVRQPKLLALTSNTRIYYLLLLRFILVSKATSSIGYDKIAPDW